jgi:hypothetical protein
MPVAPWFETRARVRFVHRAAVRDGALLTMRRNGGAGIRGC